MHNITQFNKYTVAIEEELAHPESKNNLAHCPNPNTTKTEPQPPKQNPNPDHRPNPRPPTRYRPLLKMCELYLIGRTITTEATELI